MKRRTDTGDLLHAILLMFLGIFFFIIVFCVPGCVSAPIAPNLKWPETKECPKVEVLSCPKLDMPAIPQKATISIDGNGIAVDKGGEELIRNYVKARQLLR